MLDAAGYPRGSDGTRVDKQGKPINLRLYAPNTTPDYAKDAQFIQGWFGQVGIKVSAQVLDEGTLVDDEALDTTKPAKGQLDYDMVIWGWVGDPDPNALLQILLTSSIGSTSDSQWSNAQYDQLYDQQNQAATDAERKTFMDQMQQIFYDEAPYDILYYDNNLDAYHTDKFAGWQNQPVGRRRAVLPGRLDQLHPADRRDEGDPGAGIHGQRGTERRRLQWAGAERRPGPGADRLRQQRQRPAPDRGHHRDRGPARWIHRADPPTESRRSRGRRVTKGSQEPPARVAGPA